MKCYKCKEEMFPTNDTAWRKHRDGTKWRTTEFICPECRVYATIEVNDFSECSDLEEMLKECEKK